MFDENVFSIDAVCITIRNMHLPFAQNGMLINDTRLSPDCVRWLLGDELAAITQIPSSSVNWLLDHGVSLLEVGKIAGNSVPKSVASVPVADTSRALSRVDCLLELEVSSGVPVIDV